MKLVFVSLFSAIVFHFVLLGVSHLLLVNFLVILDLVVLFRLLMVLVELLLLLQVLVSLLVLG